MVLTHHSLTHPSRGGRLLLAAGIFVSGLVAGTVIGADLSGRAARAGVAPAGSPEPLAGAQDSRQSLRGGHAVQVLRVLDGDTFEARVSVWPGIDITTKIRLRGIDAPELRARCADEQARAFAARAGLAVLLSEGAVGISQVTLDKYGGRVVADASTGRTADVAAAMLRAGHVRSYDGGRRQSWCGAGAPPGAPMERQ